MMAFLFKYIRAGTQKGKGLNSGKAIHPVKRVDPILLLVKLESVQSNFHYLLHIYKSVN